MKSISITGVQNSKILRMEKNFIKNLKILNPNLHFFLWNNKKKALFIETKDIKFLNIHMQVIGGLGLSFWDVRQSLSILILAEIGPDRHFHHLPYHVFDSNLGLFGRFGKQERERRDH